MLLPDPLERCRAATEISRWGKGCTGPAAQAVVRVALGDDNQAVRGAAGTACLALATMGVGEVARSLQAFVALYGSAAAANR